MLESGKVELAEIELSGRKVKLNIFAYYHRGKKEEPSFPATSRQGPQELIQYLEHILETGIAVPELPN